MVYTLISSTLANLLPEFVAFGFTASLTLNLDSVYFSRRVLKMWIFLTLLLSGEDIVLVER